MAPRGNKGGTKSDIRKCLRCGIILHETDASKHEKECEGSLSPHKWSGTSPLSQPNFEPDNEGRAIRTNNLEKEIPGDQSGCWGSNDNPNQSSDDISFNLSRDFDCSGRLNSSFKGSFGFISNDNVLHASVKIFKASKTGLELPPHPKQGDLVLIHPATMTLAGISIATKIRVESTDQVEVVGTAWPVDLVPQFGVVLSDDVRKTFGINKNSDIRVLITRLHPSELLTSSAITFSLLLTKSASVTDSLAFRKFLSRHALGRCFRPGAKHNLPYFGIDIVLRVTKIECCGKIVEVQNIHNSSLETVDVNTDMTGRLSNSLAKLDLDVDGIIQTKDRSNLGPGISSTPIKPGELVTRYKPSTFYIVEKDTKILFEKPEILKEKEANEFIHFSNLGGMEDIIREIQDWVKVCFQDSHGMKRLGAPLPRGILIHGPSGVGKTKLIHAILCETNCNNVNIRSADFSKSASEIENCLSELIDEAIANSPSIITMDDLDVLCPRKTSNDGERRGRATLISKLDELDRKKNHGGHVLLLGATNSLESVDTILRRQGRFDVEIEVPVPSPKQRREILRVMLGPTQHCLTISEIESLADCCHGYVGADLAALVQKAALIAIKESGKNPDVNLDLQTFKAAMKGIQPSAMKEVAIQVPNIKWEDIGGQASLKQKLKQAVEWPLKHPEAFIRMGISPPRGLLMYGPPGCSKTMVAKALAKESGLNFLSVKGPELFDKYVGESERAVREIFRRARAAAPAVVFFDEIDALASERGGQKGISKSSGVGDRVLAQMLTEIDGVQQLNGVIVIAATNRPDMVDKALLRPGRMDRMVYVPLPDTATRMEIFKLRLAKMPVDWDSVSLKHLVDSTSGFSGAEVVAVCHEAAMESLSEGIQAEKILIHHFHSALNNVKPQVTPEMVKFYEKYEQNARSDQ